MILITAFVLSLKIQAQVIIGSGIEPDKGALLDLKEQVDGSSTEGLLLPRVALVDLNVPTPLVVHVAGMYVYNTTTDGDKNLEPGTYINDGMRWVRVKDAIADP